MERRLSYLLLLLLLLTCRLLPSLAGYIPIRARSYTVLYNHSSAAIDSKRFPDQTVIEYNDYEYFSSNLDVDGVFKGDIVVGAKNTLYHLDFNLTTISNLSWPISSGVESTCIVTDKVNRNLCQNYIRTFQRIPSSTDQLLVCGTQGNVIPQCRTVNVSDGILGEGSTPIDVPGGLISYYIDAPGFGEFINDSLATGSDNRYFSASFQSDNKKFVLSYQNVNYNESNSSPLTVTRSFKSRETDDFWLRSPVLFVDFYRANYPDVLTAGDTQYYLIFLRERFEKTKDIEVIYTRMIRLCRNDLGSTSGNYFRSYLKTRIFCERKAPSNNRTINTIDFQYNVITSMAFNDNQGRRHELAAYEKLMYGAFIVSSIAPVGSAICVYRAGIAIEGGIYDIYKQDTIDYSTNPLEQAENNFFLCDNSKLRSDAEARFNVETVSNVVQMGPDPILVMDGYSITQMVVDSKCVMKFSSPPLCVNQDILLLGTSEEAWAIINDDELASGVGTILKVVFATTGTRQVDPILVEEIKLDNENSVKKMKLQMIGSHQVIFAATDSKVYRVPLDRCSRHENSCSSCIWSRDPYCVWNTDSQICELSTLMASGSAEGTVSSIYKQNVHALEDFPVVRFTQTSYNVSESEGSLSVTIEISRVIEENITIQILLKNGTAQADVDFSESTSNITIMAGETNATFNVTIIQDGILEAEDKTFTIGLQGTGIICVVTAEDVPVFILDSDMVVIEFSNAEYMISEGSSSVVVIITNSITFSELDVNVYLTTLNTGSAYAPNDFSAVTMQILTFPAGNVSDVHFPVAIVNDDIAESDENFIVMLAMASNNGNLGDRVALGSISQAEVTIMDNDGDLVVEIAGLKNKSVGLFGSLAAGIAVLVALVLIVAFLVVTVVALIWYVWKMKSNNCKYKVGTGNDAIPQTLDLPATYTNTGYLDPQASLVQRVSNQHLKVDQTSENKDFDDIQGTEGSLDGSKSHFLKVKPSDTYSDEPSSSSSPLNSLTSSPLPSSP